ncbi:MAG: hypothetical protein JNK46_06345 [Methylobacteriaceae bacterium]|nr:hypothetical protein [Methylobacteriaceae bacterium]
MRSGLARLVASVLAAQFLMSGAALAQTRAAPQGRLYVIPTSSGYGITDCFAPGSNCGKVVADAWCEAHGRGASLAFGRGEDVTASLPADQRGGQRIAPDAIVVSCGE